MNDTNKCECVCVIGGWIPIDMQNQAWLAGWLDWQFLGPQNNRNK